MHHKLVHYTIIGGGFVAACLVISGVVWRSGSPSESSKPINLTREEARSLLDGNQSTEIRAVAIHTLGADSDWDSYPKLLDLCDDPNPVIRGRAGAALQRIIGVDFHFRANDPPENRQRAIATMRKFFKDAPTPRPKQGIDKESKS